MLSALSSSPGTSTSPVSSRISSCLLLWRLQHQGQSAPAEFAEVSREVESLHKVLSEVSEQAENADSTLNRSGPVKKLELDTMLANCKTSLLELEELLHKRSSLGTGNSKILDRFKFNNKKVGELRNKISFHRDCINLYLTTRSASSLERIEQRLDQLMQQIKDGRRDSNILIPEDQKAVEGPQWNQLKNVLQNDGFSTQDLEAHKNGIRAYLVDLCEKYHLLEGGKDKPSSPSVDLPSNFPERRDSAIFEEVSTDVQEYDEEGRLRKRTITRQGSNSSLNGSAPISPGPDYSSGLGRASPGGTCYPGPGYSAALGYSDWYTPDKVYWHNWPVQGPPLPQAQGSPSWQGATMPPTPPSLTPTGTAAAKESPFLLEARSKAKWQKASIPTEHGPVELSVDFATARKIDGERDRRRARSEANYR